MKKRALFLLVGLLLTLGNGVYAQRGSFNARALEAMGGGKGFSKSGKCLVCNGKGKIKNHKYDKKKLGSREYIICKNCKGKGKKPRRIDGRRLILKNGKLLYNYTIREVSSDGVLIEYKYGIIKIPLHNCPNSLKRIIRKRIYLDDNLKIYDMKSDYKKDTLGIGSFFSWTGTPQSYGKRKAQLELNSRIDIEIINASKHKINYDRQCTLGLLIVGRPSGSDAYGSYKTYTAELLTKPTDKQWQKLFEIKSKSKEKNTVKITCPHCKKSFNYSPK